MQVAIKNLKLLLAVVFITTACFQLAGQEKKTKKAFSPGWAVGVKATTFGPGIEVVKSFNELVNVRVGASWLKLNYNVDIDDDIATINSLQTTVGEIGLMADLNFLSFMHFTGGLIYNLNKIEMFATPGDDYYSGDIPGTSTTGDQIEYRVSPNKICPYAGLGFGKSISSSKLLAFSFDFGMVYHGTPKVLLNANGLISPEDSQEQKQILQDAVDGYKWYPMVSFLLTFRIF